MSSSIVQVVLLLAAIVSLTTAAPICSLAASSRLVALQTSTTAYQATQGTPSYANKAETAFQDFINNMYITSTMRLRLAWGSSSVSNYWNTAVALHGLLDYADFHQTLGIGGMGWGEATVRQTVRDLVATQATLSGQCDAQLRNDYNDDMAWMIAALVKLWRANNDIQYINKAVVLFNTIKLSDDTSCCGGYNCGIWWNTAHSQKATASQAGAVIAAMLLRGTGVATAYTQAQWLTYAQNYYSCWRNSMVTTSGANAGAVTDHINPDGTKVNWAFSYNEGVMLGAALELFRATGTSSYLSDATQYALRLLNTGTSVSLGGATVSILRNDCGGCDGDCSQFHAPAFRYLVEYYRQWFNTINGSKGITTGTELNRLCDVHAFLKNSIDSMWLYARSSVGKFNCNWNSAFGSGTDGLQGSMNSAMSAASQFAMLPIFVQ